MLVSRGDPWEQNFGIRFFQFQVGWIQKFCIKIFSKNYTIGIEVYRVSAIDYLSYK